MNGRQPGEASEMAWDGMGPVSWNLDNKGLYAVWVRGHDAPEQQGPVKRKEGL